MMRPIYFLSMEEILLLHDYHLNKDGGMHGLRDKGLLESAINMPQATFGGESLYTDIFEMAAVYAYGLIKNHPFCDGNKRTGIMSALIFLGENGFAIEFSDKEFFDIAIDIATSKLSIQDIAHILQQHSKTKKS